MEWEKEKEKKWRAERTAGTAKGKIEEEQGEVHL
jgi:hypothetical protein